MGCGKTGPAQSVPSPKCFDLCIYILVFWIMLLFHCILTLMNDLFQRENQVFKPTSSLVLLHCGVGKDWAGTCPSKLFRSSFFSFSLLDYATLSLYLNIPKRESSFQTNMFILHCGVGERLGRPILSPLQNVLIFIIIFQSFGLCYSFTVS